MSARLHAAAEQRQHSTVGRRQELGRRRRNRGGPHFGDQPSVHDRQRLTGLRTEQHDHCHMGRCAGGGILRVEADELRPHRLRCDGRHDAEISLSFFYRQHIPYRLQNPPERKIGKGLLHRRDQAIPAQQAADSVLVQIHYHRSRLGAGFGRMIDPGWPGESGWGGQSWRRAMRRPIKLLLLVITGLASAAAQAQLLGPAFESGITLTQEDLNIMRQTVNQQIHGKPVGTTASWANPNSKNSGTIKLLKKFNARNMRCETIGYTLMTTAAKVEPEHYEFNSCLQPDGSWKIL